MIYFFILTGTIQAAKGMIKCSGGSELVIYIFILTGTIQAAKGKSKCTGGSELVPKNGYILLVKSIASITRIGVS